MNTCNKATRRRSALESRSPDPSVSFGGRWLGRSRLRKRRLSWRHSSRTYGAAPETHHGPGARGWLRSADHSGGPMKSSVLNITEIAVLGVAFVVLLTTASAP